MKLIYRVLIYLLGLLLLAFGVAFSVNSNLGVSPVNSLPYAVSVASGIDMGTCVIIVFASYILVQIALLRREFKPVNLLQIIFSSIFGYFVNFTKMIVGSFTLPTYFGQLAMLAISIVIVAFGLTFYLSAELLPMPIEGMTLAITGKQSRLQFPQVKVAVDSASVTMAALVTLAATGAVTGVREGTIISALLIGKVLGIFMKPLRPLLRAICFESEAPAAAPKEESAGAS